MLRWKYFVQSEDDAFVALIDAFTKATGVKVNISRESLRGRAAEGLGRGQHRRGPGPVLGPLLAAASVPAEVRRRHRRRRLSRQEIRRLGAERGHLRQERQQVDRDSGLLQRQPDELPHRGLEEGRLLGVPEDHRRVPRLCQGDEGAGHARRLGARPRLGRRQWLGALVPVGARRQPGRRRGQGHHQLAGDREGARTTPRRCTTSMIPGTASWNDAFNNKAFLASEISLDQQRHLDLRRGQPRSESQGDRRRHEPRLLPVGPVGKPTEFHICVSDAGDDLHQVSAGLQGAHRLHAGGGATSTRGSERRGGYLTHLLNAYDANPVWTADPEAHGVPRRRQAHADGGRARLGRREGGGGARRLRACSTCSPAVCTGREDVKGAIAIAERQCSGSIAERDARRGAARSPRRLISASGHEARQ